MKNKVETFNQTEDYLFDKNGYVYKQLINVSKDELEEINQYILDFTDEDFEKYPVAKWSFIKPIELDTKNIAFIPNVIRNIVSEVLCLELVDENTCLQID